MIQKYTYEGPKDQDFKMYEKLVFLDDNVADIEVEKVADYSVALSQILIWLRSAIDLRIADVNARRKSKRAAQGLREDAMDAEEERKEKCEIHIEDKKAEFDQRKEDERAARVQLAKDAGEDTPAEDADEDDEVFDAEQVAADFDDEYPAIDIPPEVIADVDNDFDDVLETIEHSAGDGTER